MFTTLNLRWIIDLKEREMRANWIGNPQPRWLQALVSLFRRPLLQAARRCRSSRTGCRPMRPHNDRTGRSSSSHRR
jgi:hypothetical protein